MKSENTFTNYKIIIIVLGFLCFLFSLINLRIEEFSWKFLVFLLFTLTLSSRLIFSLPRSKFHLSFSDSIIFLSFLFFDGYIAIFIANIETFTNCYYLRYKGLVFNRHAFLYNIASTSLCTTLTLLSFQLILMYANFSFLESNIAQLFTFLSCLALLQFIYTSLLASIFYSLKSNISLWSSWKNECFSISVTYLAGASVAGITYKLIKNGDYFATSIALIIIIVAYFNYRKVIIDITASLEEAETAQKEKAESDRIRAEQAEKHADELALALSEQEIISEKLQQSHDALEYSAYYDALTKLPNRAYLIERLGLLLELGIDISNKYYVLFLDLKRFKNINNRLGHAVGDKVLVLAAKRLLRSVKLEDTVARLGGDEFAIILNDLKSPEEATKYAKKIYQKLTQPFALNGHKVFLDVNIGISAFEPEHSKPEDILRDADIAMHFSKEKETEFALFDKNLRSRVLETIKLESYLRFALEKKELSMYYQPLISLKNGEIIGFEALLRWNHPVLGFVSPAQFIPIAEDSGLIIPITEWILQEATGQIAKWQRISANYRELMVSVNISGKHISQDGLIKSVSQSLKSAKLHPGSLKLEITESTAMEDAERTVEVLTGLKKLGTQLSIDDFGTGYSSLSYLHRLPFDTLKIDRSFVYSVGENGENSEILQTIISLAKNLKMRVIAEGIETEEQLRLLRDLGCDYGQGFLMSKPLPKEQMEALLYQKQHWFPTSFVADEFGRIASDAILNEIIYSSKVS
jgi:diguanylate cyclase (GGDEF)-like protein